MKTLHAFLFSFLFFTQISFAQTYKECGTTINEQGTTYEFVQKQRLQAFTKPQIPVMNEVPVKIHIIGADNGFFAIDSVDVFEELVVANELFAAANIQFTSCENVNYIYDNDYVTFVKNTDELLCDLHDKPDAINIYFVPFLVKEVDSGFEDLCGYAHNFDIKPRVFMDKGCSTNGSTLAHELGHSFSLLHTHSTSHGEELVNGSNCSTAGDLLCDTPADPELSNDLVNSVCEYVGTELDNQQNPYMPDVANIMSYSRKACRIHFSTEQLLQMEDFYWSEGYFLTCIPEVTSTNNISDDLNIEIYPNPSNGSIFIKNVPERASLELMDLQGKKLWQSQKESVAEVIEMTLLPNLAAGIYFLQIISNHQIYTHKVMIE